MEFYMPRLLFITSKLISLEPADLPPSLQHFHGYYEIGPSRGSCLPVTTRHLPRLQYVWRSRIAQKAPHCSEEVIAESFPRTSCGEAERFGRGLFSGTKAKGE
jgi:hypothetical protein